MSGWRPGLWDDGNGGERAQARLRVPGVRLTLPINSGPGWGRLQAGSNHESELQDAFQPALHCLASHMATAQTEMEWVNGYGNHSHTSIQVICGRVCIECSSSGVSLIIPCCRHTYDKRQPGEKNHQLRSRRRNGCIWSCLLCGSPYPPTAWSKAVCAA